jgi:hypothetical protein
MIEIGTRGAGKPLATVQSQQDPVVQRREAPARDGDGVRIGVVGCGFKPWSINNMALYSSSTDERPSSVWRSAPGAGDFALLAGRWIMTIPLKDDFAAQITDALVAALRANGGEAEDRSVLGQTREWKGRRLRKAVRLLEEQQESAALEQASRATPAHLLANLEAALTLALACARDRICTDPSKDEYDSVEAQALEQLEKFHPEVRRIMAIPRR